MNVDASKVIEKLQSIIAQQAVQIAALQIQVEELNRQLQELYKRYQVKE